MLVSTRNLLTFGCLVLAGCSDAPVPSNAPETAPSIQVLKNTPVWDVSLQEVVDTYVLGGSRTDLQRENITAKLVGATVSWQFKVYNISKENGRYRVVSELLNGSDPSAFGKVSVVAFVEPRDRQDVQSLLQLNTGSEVRVRGRVDGVTARMAVVLSPAEVVR